MPARIARIEARRRVAAVHFATRGPLNREEVLMTTKADFTPQEWELVREGPPSAGMIVITAHRGGMFRETISIAKAYAEARERHGQSQLLDEIVASKPEVDHTRFHSPEELKEHALQHIRDAIAL